MNNEDRRKVFEEHLTEQNRQRQKILQQKKALQNLKNNPQEDMLFIQKEFRSLGVEMTNLISQYKNKEIDFVRLQEHFNNMKKYYVDISYVLATFDRQTYKQQLDKTNQNMLELKNKFQPKKKFKFSRRNEDFGVQEGEKVVQTKEKITKQVKISGLDGINNQTLTIRQNWPQVGSYRIINCQNTTVILEETTEILFLKNLKKCTIKTALTKSTVFIDSCTECSFEVSCHQLRIHNTFDTTFGVYVTSKAIIEDCDRVQFKPYSFMYERREKNQEEFQRKNKPNLWREVQDFNWLKQNQKSPHFSLME